MTADVEKQKINLIGYLEKSLYRYPSRLDRVRYNDSHVDDGHLDKGQLNALRELADIAPNEQIQYIVSNPKTFSTFLYDTTTHGNRPTAANIPPNLAEVIKFAASINRYEDPSFDPNLNQGMAYEVDQKERQLLSQNQPEYLKKLVHMGHAWSTGSSLVATYVNQQHSKFHPLVKSAPDVIKAMNSFISGLNYPEPDKTYGGYEREPVNTFFNQVVEKLAALKASNETSYNLIVERLDGDFPDLKFAEKVQALSNTPSGAGVVPKSIEGNTRLAQNIA